LRSSREVKILLSEMQSMHEHSTTDTDQADNLSESYLEIDAFLESISRTCIKNDWLTGSGKFAINEAMN